MNLQTDLVTYWLGCPSKIVFRFFFRVIYKDPFIQRTDLIIQRLVDTFLLKLSETKKIRDNSVNVNTECDHVRNFFFMQNFSEYTRLV